MTLGQGLLATLLLGACGSSAGTGAPPTPPPVRAGADARPAPVDAMAPPPVIDAAPAWQPRPPAERLRDELMAHGEDWVRRTYGPPTPAEVDACEAECARRSAEANRGAARDDLRRLGCARVSCEQDCAVTALADFRCH